MVRLEELGQSKKSYDLIGNRTRDFPACCIVPQLTTLPRTPQLKGVVTKPKNLSMKIQYRDIRVNIEGMEEITL
jgi:hypothetical protein